MIASAITGIITGLGGSLLTNIFNLFNQKQKNRHELDLIAARTAEAKAESEANIQQLKIEGDIQADIAAASAFALSQQLGNKTAAPTQLIEKLFNSNWTAWLGAILVFLLGVVDVVRNAIRPGITIMLMIITAYITSQFLAFLVIDRTLVSSAQLFTVIDSIIYLTFTVVGWWFGDRRMAKFAYRLSDGNTQNK